MPGTSAALAGQAGRLKHAFRGGGEIRIPAMRPPRHRNGRIFGAWLGCAVDDRPRRLSRCRLLADQIVDPRRQQRLCQRRHDGRERQQQGHRTARNAAPAPPGCASTRRQRQQQGRRMRSPAAAPRRAGARGGRLGGHWVSLPGIRRGGCFEGAGHCPVGRPGGRSLGGRSLGAFVGAAVSRVPDTAVWGRPGGRSLGGQSPGHSSGRLFRGCRTLPGGSVIRGSVIGGSVSRAFRRGGCFEGAGHCPVGRPGGRSLGVGHLGHSSGRLFRGCRTLRCGSAGGRSLGHSSGRLFRGCRTLPRGSAGGSAGGSVIGASLWGIRRGRRREAIRTCLWR